ncbi:MAG TPA: FAD-dependent oxidoreductase [Campylobacterales bacterium]|nr:FAD-dependent oxidoreductase [Campylobacterales bacterium]
MAGASTALYLSQLGLDVSLYEQQSSVVSGPPWCHLHAGGNLYREISDEQCTTLLEQSIDFVKLYPYVVDYRPTVIALAHDDKSYPLALLPRLNLLKESYAKLIEKDKNNQVLGESRHYYKLYDKESMKRLQQRKEVENPKSNDEWMIAVAKNLDFKKVQFPLVLVQEYGLNIFRLASGLMLDLEASNNVTLKLNTSVNNIKPEDRGWSITSSSKGQEETLSYDYLINAAGFQTGKIDDMLGVKCERMVEFKASYIAQWQESATTAFPEIIVHGERGTPKGMAQFTPYPKGYFQLHGMTSNITLYEDGLVKSSQASSQPQLKQKFLDKVNKGWEQKEIDERTNAAIEHVGNFVPNFNHAVVGSQPLFGAQQILGKDATLRVAEVSFPLANYARCEIIKVSSVTDMMQSIVKELINNEYLTTLSLSHNPMVYPRRDEEKLKVMAEEIAKERGYPAEMANRNVAYLL